MSSQTIPIPGPLSIGDIIDRAFRIYRARFKPMLLTALALLVPLGVLTGVLSYLLNRPVLEGTGADLDTGLMLGSTLGTLLLSVLSMLVQGLAELALTFHARAALENEALEPGQAISAAFGRIGSWLGMSILRALAYIGAIAVAFVPTVLVAALAGSASSNSAAALAVGLTCLFSILFIGLFILAIILYVRWIVATPALVVEEFGATGSLGRSWGLTKGKFWRTLGVTLVLTIIALVVLSLPNFVMTMVAITSERTAAWSAVSTALGTVLSALFVPLSAATYLVLYYDLRVRRENLDLDLRVQQLEAETAPQEEPEA